MCLAISLPRQLDFSFDRCYLLIGTDKDIDLHASDESIKRSTVISRMI